LGCCLASRGDRAGHDKPSFRRIQLSQSAIRLIIILVGLGLLLSAMSELNPLPLIVLVGVAWVALQVARAL
jgi:hypothetical protein